jgi:hypothetical protein
MHSFNQLRERARFVRGMVSRLGYPQVPVSYRRAARWAGKSQYSLKRLLRFAVDAGVSFSYVPLRIATWIGFLGLSVCITYFIHIMIANALWGVPGSRMRFGGGGGALYPLRSVNYSGDDGAIRRPNV